MVRIIQSATFLFISLVLLTSCNETEKPYQGELYIKLVSIGPEIFNIDHEVGLTMGEWLDTLDTEDYQSKEEKNLKEYYDFVNKHYLIDKPYFHVIFNENNKNVYRVYISKSEYSKVDTFKLNVLQDQNQRVLVDFTGIQLDERTILSNKIQKFTKVTGDTKWHK